MNDNRPKTPAGAWPITLVAMFVLYVLGVGPVAGLVGNHRLPSAIETPLSLLYTPFSLVKNTDAYRDYVRWWVKALRSD